MRVKCNGKINDCYVWIKSPSRVSPFNKWKVLCAADALKTECLCIVEEDKNWYLRHSPVGRGWRRVEGMTHSHYFPISMDLTKLMMLWYFLLAGSERAISHLVVQQGCMLVVWEAEKARMTQTPRDSQKWGWFWVSTGHEIGGVYTNFTGSGKPPADIWVAYGKYLCRSHGNQSVSNNKYYYA